MSGNNPMFCFIERFITIFFGGGLEGARYAKPQTQNYMINHTIRETQVAREYKLQILHCILA